MTTILQIRNILFIIFTSWMIIISCSDNEILENRDIPDIPDSVKTDWLIMGYFAGDNNLASNIMMDIEKMMSANLDNQTRVRVIVLADHDGAEDSYLFKIRHGKVEYLTCSELGIYGLSPGEVDTGNPSTLSTFINYVKSRYSASYYALIISGHGSGWKTPSNRKNLSRAIGGDDFSRTSLSIHDLQISTMNQGINVIALDSCLMGMIETAYELRKSVTGIDYLVSSEEVTSGYPYDLILDDLITSSEFTPSDMAKIIVNNYHSFYPPDSIFGQSAIDLSHINEVLDAINPFSTYLNSLNSTVLDAARGNCESYYYAEYVDLYSFADNFNDPTAINLKSAISDAVLISRSGSANPGSHGLSINFTTVNHDADYNNVENPDIDFLIDSSWDEFLKSRTFGYTIDHDEPANDKPGVVIIHNGSSCNGYPIDTNDKDYYSLTIKTAGTVNIDLSTVPRDVDLDLYLYKNDDITPVAKLCHGVEGENEKLDFSEIKIGDNLHLLVIPCRGLSFIEPYHISFSGSAIY